MKRTIIKTCLSWFLLAAILIGCSSPSAKLHNALKDYTKIVEGPIPDNLRLTIYYMDPNILTRKPLSTDELINFPDTEKITIEAKELAPVWALFKKLDPAELQLAEGESYIDARLYYVLELGDSEKLLEVVISQINGHVFVNSIAVMDHPVFFELVEPFLPEEACNMFSI